MTSSSLSLRQRKILHYLEDRTDFTPSIEIAKALNVSSRTVRNEIKEINEILSRQDIQILSVHSKGFLLHASAVEKLKKNKLENSLFLSREERIRYLALRLCESNCPLNLYDLEEEIFVSHSALMNDLRVLKQQFSHEPPFIRIVLKHDEVSFEANEHKIRQVLLGIFHKDWDYRSARGLYYDVQFLDEALLSALQDHTASILYQHGIFLDEPTLIALELYLVIMHHRYSTGHQHPDQPEIKLLDANVLQVTNCIFTIVEAETKCNYPKSEKDVVYHFIEASQLHFNDWGLSNTTEFSKDTLLQNEVSCYLERIQSIFHVDFSHDPGFMQTLYIFLHQLSSGNSLFSHCQINAIKENLSAEYELAFLYQTLAPDFIGRFLNEDELCSLAVILSGAIRHFLAVHPEKKLRAVLFTHSSVAHAWSLKRKILERFDLYLDIRHVLPLSFHKMYDFSNTDLILTTVRRNLSVPASIDIVVLDDHPLAEMVDSEMRIKLLSFKNIWSVPPYSLTDLLSNAFWHENADLNDIYQIIDTMGHDFVENQIADESLVLQITRRETRSSFAIKPGLIFLHSALPAKKTMLSVMTLQHRVRWNDFRIGTIIMAVFREEDINLLFQLKIRFCNQTFNPEELRAKRTRAELIPYLCQ